MKICNKAHSIESIDNHYLVRTNNADIKIVFMTDEIVRIRASFSKEMEEASYILSLTAWKDRLDAMFSDEERTRISGIKPAVTESDDCVEFLTSSVKLVMKKEPLGFKLYDSEGDLLYSDLEGNPYVLDSNNRITHYSAMEEDDCFYGFGEKTGELNKNKRFLRERATDAMGYDPEYADTLYKHIPFYIQLRRRTGKAVGVFYNNFFESVFNMGCEKSNYWPRYSYWQADGGDIDCFLIGGGSIRRIVDNYTLLTGRPVLLPKRALGYQASSMYYSELDRDCDDAILNFINTITEEDFPIDGFHLSSGYTSSGGKRYVFTWNRTRFKDPEKFFETMNRMSAQNVPNVKPGILLTHPYFDEFERKGAFVRSSENTSVYAVGKWWGGRGSFLRLLQSSCAKGVERFSD